MSQAGIDTDHRLRAGQQSGHGENAERGRYHRARHGARDALAAGALRGVAPWQNRDSALPRKFPPEPLPRLLRPKLVGAAGRVQQHAVGPGLDRRRTRGHGDAVVQRGRQLVSQGHRGEAPVAHDRVQIARHHVNDVVELCCQRLARARAGITVAHAGGGPRQECALDQALGVDNAVVAHARERTAELAELAPVRSLERIRAPAPQRHRNRPAHPRMQADDVAISFLHHPIDACVRETRADVAHHRQVVHHVAERGSLDEQYIGHARGK